MRIIHFIKWLRLRDGGTVRAVLDLCAGLAARGHTVTALSCDDSGVPQEWRLADQPSKPRSVVLRLRDPLWERGGRTMADATRDTLTQYLPADSMEEAGALLREADVLHLHGVWANCNHQLARLADRLGVPYVVSPHGMLDDWSMSQGAAKKKLHLALLSRKTLNRAKAVHCTARAELTQAQAHFSSGTGVVIPLLFDLSGFQNPPGPEPAARAFPDACGGELPKVLFLSRLHMKKGCDLLIDAAAVAHKAGRPFTLLLAGPADPPEYLDDLQARAAQAGISHLVHFLGMVTGPEKVSLYQSADLFVLPTSQENFGFVLLEAMAAGTPVVTTRGVDIWPELESSGGARIVERETVAIAAAIEALLADAPARHAMGQAGRRWALSHLDSRTTLAAFETAYGGGVPAE